MKPFVLLAALTLFPSGSAHAQFLNPFNTCGACAPRAVVVRPNPCITCAPVAVPRVSYRNVVETRYRNEQVVQQVPVTRYRNVTVDEGGYQTVWVPRLVNKQVAETVLEQRIGTRTVPYQVTRTVPQMSSCGSPAISIAPSQPVQLQSPISYGNAPVRSSSGVYLAPPVQAYDPGASSHSTSGLVPDPRHLDPPSAATLNDLSSSMTAPYDSQATYRSPVKSRAASSVFRQYR